MSRACGRQGGPEGPWRDEKSHGSIPHGRDHGGGDHPAPFRTRQLSPPSPRVLRREAAGGQDVAPMEDAFLSQGRPPGGPAAFAGPRGRSRPRGPATSGGGVPNAWEPALAGAGGRDVRPGRFNPVDIRIQCSFANVPFQVRKSEDGSTHIETNGAFAFA